MAELEMKYGDTPGILKEIDEGARDLVFQALQEDIYSFPIRSFVREAICNGLDAVVERDIYFNIFGGDPVDKYYRQLNDNALLKDSGYDADYYHIDHLSKETAVLVEYLIPEDSRRHLIRIQDHGVGLGGDRLKGFFRIGYSSKRNMKDVFGKFGAGAKAGLATGEDYFMMTTIYNGYKTSFMILKTDYEATTPQSSKSKPETWNIKMVNGDTGERTIHWEPTDEMNGVTIELEVKPFNRQAFHDAVIQQFQHFNGKVKFRYQNVGDDFLYTNWLDTKPHYESEKIILPKWSSYYVPTILVDGINYGPISWPALELEDHKGEIAIKTYGSDVDITQSRESLKWTEKTKKVVLEGIAAAEAEATAHLAKQLELHDPYDLVGMIRKYRNLKKDSDPITATFAKFLNKSNLKPVYEFKPEWCVDSEIPTNFKLSVDTVLWDLLFVACKVRAVTLSSRNGKVKVNTQELYNFDAFIGNIVVFAHHRRIGPKTAYKILQEYDVDSFIYVNTSIITDASPMESGVEGIRLNPHDMSAYTRQMMQAYCDVDLDEYSYEEDIKDETLEDAELKVDKVTLAEIRRKNQQILYHTHPYNNWRLTKTTIKIADIGREFKDHKNLCIATQDFRDYGYMLQLAPDDIIGDDFKVIYVSRDHVRDFLPFGKFITDYIYTVEDGIMYPGELVKYVSLKQSLYDVYKKYKDLRWNTDIIEMFSTTFSDEPEYLESIAYPARFGHDYIQNGAVRVWFEEFLKEVKRIYDEQSVGIFNEKDPKIVGLYERSYAHDLEVVLKELNYIPEFMDKLYHAEPEMKSDLELLIKHKKEQQ